MSRRIALLLGVLCALSLMLPRRAGAQEAVEYYATDALGSVRVVFASNGTVKGRMDFGPYGEQLTTAEGIGQKVFAQITFDGETAMDYAEARMFQSRTGRFNAPDPVLASIANPQAFNRYAYVASNPMSFVDPSGMVALQCTSIPDDSPIGREFHLRISQCNLVSSAGTHPEQRGERSQPGGRDQRHQPGSPPDEDPAPPDDPSDETETKTGGDCNADQTTWFVGQTATFAP